MKFTDKFDPLLIDMKPIDFESDQAPNIDTINAYQNETGDMEIFHKLIRSRNHRREYWIVSYEIFNVCEIDYSASFEDVFKEIELANGRFVELVNYFKMAKRKLKIDTLL